VTVRKTALLYSLLTFALFIGSSQIAQAQTLIAPEPSAAADFLPEAGSASGAILSGEPGSLPYDPKSSSQTTPDPDKLKVVIYPVLGWAPIMGAHVRVPDTPSTPGGGSGNTNSSLNGAALFGFTIQKDKWYGEANAMWGGMTASRTSPHLNVDVNAVFAGGLVGYKVYRDFYFTGGFRRLALDYDITLGTFPSFKRKPGVWDPLIGVLWNRQLSKKWTAKVNAQGGGFGVGADVDWSVLGTADWQFAKHFGLTMGYGVLHFSVSDSVPQLGTLKVSQTLNGPQFGFGIYF
jgi:hypothetical protein